MEMFTSDATSLRLIKAKAGQGAFGSLKRAQLKGKQSQMESSTAKPNRCRLERTIWDTSSRIRNSVWPLKGGENPLDMHRSVQTLLWDQPQYQIRCCWERDEKKRALIQRLQRSRLIYLGEKSDTSKGTSQKDIMNKQIISK